MTLTMASLNDNLFTTLVNHAHPQEFGCYLLTRFGTLKVHIASQGIEALSFEDSRRPKTSQDCVFRVAFLNWLRSFQEMPADEQWHQLNPKGTDFQQQVWRTLLTIPIGQHLSYREVAANIGQPSASRAVGSAIAANPIALLIPCHRVVPVTNAPGNYRWGADRKLALLDAEQLPNATLHQLFE